jgi:histone H3/H4
MDMDRQRPSTSNRQRQTNREADEISYDADSEGDADSEVQPPQPISRPRPRKRQKPTKKEEDGEERFLRDTVHQLKPKSPFSRLIREILHKFAPKGVDFGITPEALCALQEAAEIWTVHLFEDAYRWTLVNKRFILTVEDLQLARYLRGI